MKRGKVFVPMVMRRIKHYSYLILLTLLSMGCASDTSPQALVTRRCSRCHTLERVYAVKKDAEGWQITVKKMASYASGVIRDEEIPIITEYLTRTQGTGR